MNGTSTMSGVMLTPGTLQIQSGNAAPNPQELYAALRRRRAAYALVGRLTLDTSRPWLDTDDEREAAYQAVRDAEQAVRGALAAIEGQL